MYYALMSYGLYFYTFSFNKYHYTDALEGCEYHYIAYMEKGHGKIVAENITIEINPGDVFFIPKGLSYQSYWNSDNEIQFKSFGFDVFPNSKEENYPLQIIACNHEIAEQVKALPTNTNVSCRLLADFYDSLANLLPYMQRDSLSYQKLLLEKAKNYIISNTNYRNSDIARLCLISETALYELFKKEKELTPNTIRQKFLCEKAVLLLSTTDKSIQEISDTLGFSSTSYFRKQMHKHIGQTPREIRKNSTSP